MKSLSIAAVALSVLLSACGGGGGGSSGTPVTSVKVVGASLADSGTYGYKFTVQPAGSTSYQVYSERIASGYGVSGFCSAYTWSGSAFATHAGCTNYAVGGAAVNNYASGAGVDDTTPLSVIRQLQDVGNAGFTANDLLIVGEASSNDAADLAAAFLDEVDFIDGADYSDMLPTLLTTTQIDNNAGDPTTQGVLYMQALADKLFAAIKTNALDKGAPRVVILNSLDVIKTPMFQAKLALITAAHDDDATTADARAAVVKAWIEAYNARLAADVAASAYAGRIAIVDLYARFNAQLAAPASYGLTNTSATVCDQIATGGIKPGETALTDATVRASCTDSAAASLALGGTADGWKTYLFADNFHPTPYGHQLLADLVTASLTAKGWK